MSTRPELIASGKLKKNIQQKMLHLQSISYVTEIITNF